jgi:hypothetical protein
LTGEVVKDLNVYLALEVQRAVEKDACNGGRRFGHLDARHVEAGTVEVF